MCLYERKEAHTMRDTPVYSFAAFSGAGKTTYLERLIPALKAWGLRVGIVKHHGHDTELDQEGKDSWRFARAGADVTAVVSPGQAAFIENRGLDPEEAVERIWGVDLILAEGYKRGPWPRILVCRGDGERAVLPEDCVAVVSDRPVVCAAPVFPLDDPEPMAAWLAARVEEHRDRRRRK